MSDFIANMTKGFDTYSNAHKKVAQYVLYHMDSIAFKPLEEISNDVGVSTTTIIRFARVLGYSGYSELQNKIREIVLNKSIIQKTESKGEVDDFLRESFELDIDNLNQTLLNQNKEDLSKAIDLICSARKLFIFGLRTSYTLAYYSYIRFGQLREEVILVQSNGMTYPEELINITKDDAILVFAFPRLVRLSQEIMSWITKKEIPMILVTSTHEVMMSSNHGIIIPCQVIGQSYHNSSVAPMAMINYLSSMVATQSESVALETVKKIEDIMGEDFYYR